MGFRVTTNTTLFDGADPNSVREFFDEMTELGVEGMMVSPGYAYPKAPNQKSFMRARKKTNEFFEMVLSNRKRKWVFNQSPLFLEYLMGKREYECTPWGNPTYNIFGWQKPCYLLQDGYVDTFEELMEANRVGELRARQRQPRVPAVHGPLRVRAQRRRPHVQLLRRALRDGQGDGLLEVREPEGDEATRGREGKAPRPDGDARADGRGQAER